MTDFHAEIVIDATAALATFDRIQAAGADLGPLMADLAEGLLHRTEDRFDRQRAPDGTPWAPLSPRYAARKAKKKGSAPLLVFEGRLRGELRSEWGPDFAEVATAPLPYAALHQFGGTPGMPPGPAAVPARPYMGASDDDLAWIESRASEYLDRIVAAG